MPPGTSTIQTPLVTRDHSDEISRWTIQVPPHPADLSGLIIPTITATLSVMGFCLSIGVGSHRLIQLLAALIFMAFAWQLIRTARSFRALHKGKASIRLEIDAQTIRTTLHSRTLTTDQVALSDLRSIWVIPFDETDTTNRSVSLQMTANQPLFSASMILPKAEAEQLAAEMAERIEAHHRPDTPTDLRFLDTNDQLRAELLQDALVHPPSPAFSVSTAKGKTRIQINHTPQLSRKNLWFGQVFLVGLFSLAPCVATGMIGILIFQTMIPVIPVSAIILICYTYSWYRALSPLAFQTRIDLDHQDETPVIHILNTASNERTLRPDDLKTLKLKHDAIHALLPYKDNAVVAVSHKGKPTICLRWAESRDALWLGSVLLFHLNLPNKQLQIQQN